jgi:hypothetical protein
MACQLTLQGSSPLLDWLNCAARGWHGGRVRACQSIQGSELATPSPHPCCIASACIASALLQKKFQALKEKEQERLQKMKEREEKKK